VFVVFANVLQPLIDFFEAILKFFHDSAGLSWGWAIVALTIVVRAALLPLTLKQFKSMQRLAQFQPEIKRLQEKHKNDRERLNQEMMRFYRENKVNPFTSCLPMIAQIPVFLSLFYMLRNDLRTDICPELNPPGTANPQPCGETEASSFFFIPDLTDKATGTVLIVLIVLYVGSQLLSTVLMSTTTDRNQKLIMYALPFFFVAFIWNFPAGLLVYWITTNLWTIVQQAIVRKRLGPLRPPDLAAATAAATGDSTTGAGESGRSGGGGALGRVTGRKERAEELVEAGNHPKPRSGGPPPPPPRKKKKRSGRRR
jgi:YidC/Oxa1 family membrane protein insertase